MVSWVSPLGCYTKATIDWLWIFLNLLKNYKTLQWEIMTVHNVKTAHITTESYHGIFSWEFLFYVPRIWPTFPKKQAWIDSLTLFQLISTPMNQVKGHSLDVKQTQHDITVFVKKICHHVSTKYKWNNQQISSIEDSFLHPNKLVGGKRLDKATFFEFLRFVDL